MTREDVVESAYAKAAGAWSGADWTHERGSAHCARHGDGNCYDDNCTTRCDECHADPAYCDGSAGCGTCEDASADAASAEDAGRRAIEEYRRGALEAALECAHEACEIEGRWGDCPTWGPLRDLLATHGRGGRSRPRRPGVSGRGDPR